MYRYVFYFRTHQQAVYGLTAAAAGPRMVAQRLAFGVQVANLQVRILFCEMCRTRFAQNGASPNFPEARRARRGIPGYQPCSSNNVRMPATRFATQWCIGGPRSPATMIVRHNSCKTTHQTK